MPRPVGGSHRVGVVRLSGQRVRGGTLPRRWMMMVCRARGAPGPAGGVASRFRPRAEGAAPAPDTLKWTPASGFGGWLEPRIARARLVHAHMMGAWWAAARAVPPGVPLVASEHNQMSWPRGDHTPQARDAARRVDMFFAHGPAARAWAAGIGLDDGRLRDGRSSAGGQTPPPWPRLPLPRLSFPRRPRCRPGRWKAAPAMGHLAYLREAQGTGAEDEEGCLNERPSCWTARGGAAEPRPPPRMTCAPAVQQEGRSFKQPSSSSVPV